MKGKLAGVVIGVLPLFFLAPAVPALAQGGSPKPVVITPTHHDVSPRWSEMVAAAPARAPKAPEEMPLLRTPPIPGANGPIVPDQDLQTITLPLVGTTNGLNFEGVGFNSYYPPDPNGSAGDNQFMEITNVEFEIFNKTTGSSELGPALIDTLWSGFSGNCASGNGGDPVGIYDKAAKRWVVSQINDGYDAWCMAVSTSDDATGSYYRYEFDFGSNLPDYPKVGVWPDAYYWSSNTFQNGSAFIGAQACAFDRANMLSGGAANAICFQENSSVASLLPADLDGSTAPPSGENEFYLELDTTSSLGLFKFHVDFSVPGNSTFTGPTAITVNTFNEACGGGNCIPQPGTSEELDSLGDRLMFRNAYRNLGGTEYLVVDHSVTAGSSVGVRWYQIENPNGTPTVSEQGTFAPDSTYRWMGSVAMDQAGDIAAGYSVSASSSVYPGIRYTGRVPSDPPGTFESEDTIIAGSGSQTGTYRWGDYTSMSIDPSDDCTFWYTDEYYPANGSYDWHTRIGSFKFTSCGSTTSDFTISASPSSQTVTQGGNTTYTATVTPVNGYSGTDSLSVSGCPSNTTCTLNPTSVILPPAQNSTLTVQTTSTTPTGTYTLTITGTDGTLTHNTTVTLVVNSSNPPNFSISASPSSVSVKRGSSAHYTASLTSMYTFSGNVTLSVTGLPSGSTGSFTPNPVSVPSGGKGTSTLTVSTGKKTATGTFTLTIKGTSGNLNHSTTVTLTVTAK